MDSNALRVARAQAGFKTPDERVQEEAAQVEMLARRHVYEKLEAYRRFIRDFERVLAHVERAAPRWESTRDFDRFQRGYRRRVRTMEARFEALQSAGRPRGSTFSLAERSFRAWEDLNTGLGPMQGQTARFDKIVRGLRANLATLSQALDGIESDERLRLEVGGTP